MNNRTRVTQRVQTAIRRAGVQWTTAHIMAGMTDDDLADFAAAYWRDVQTYVELFSGPAPHRTAHGRKPAIVNTEPQVPESPEVDAQDDTQQAA